MNHFDWDNLRVFLGVARARSALEASHSLGMNQSTISRRLHRLEREKQQGGAIASLNAMADTMAIEAARAAALPPAGGEAE